MIEFCLAYCVEDDGFRKYIDCLNIVLKSASCEKKIIHKHLKNLIKKYPYSFEILNSKKNDI